MLECRLARLDFRKLDDPVTDPRVLAFFGKLDDPVTDRSHGNWVTQLHGTRHPRSYINICYDHYGAFGEEFVLETKREASSSKQNDVSLS